MANVGFDLRFENKEKSVSEKFLIVTPCNGKNSLISN